MGTTENTYTDNHFLKMETSRKSHFNQDKVVFTLAKEVLTKENMDFFDFDKEDYQLSRDYFLNGVSLRHLASERGIVASNVISTKKKVLRPFRKMLERTFHLRQENARLQKVNEELRKELVSCQNNCKELREERSLLLTSAVSINDNNNATSVKFKGNRYYIPQSLGLSPKLIQSLTNYDVALVGKTGCFLWQYYRNVRAMGKERITQIEDAIMTVEAEHK